MSVACFDTFCQVLIFTGVGVVAAAWLVFLPLIWRERRNAKRRSVA